MPRMCSVPVEEAVALIVQFKDHFSNGTLPRWRDNVWRDMSAVLNNRWTFRCLYINVVQDRRNILSLAMKLITKKEDTQEIIENIGNMLDDSKFQNLIQEFGSMPIWVFYSDERQLSVYKKYCRSNEGSSTICIDAAGSVVEPLKRDNSNMPGLVLLYAIVVKFKNTTVAVEQMLSETHDFEFIMYWLRMWLKKGAPIPKKVVCSYSRPFLCALSLAFNGATIEKYIKSRYNSILRRKAIVHGHPTLIRVDATHLIQLVCRWKCITDASQTCVKDFFVRCVALMVECPTLETFERIFTLTCVVALQIHEDTEVDPSLAPTTESARKQLESYMAWQGIKATFIESQNKSISNESGEVIVDPLDFPLGPDDSETEVFVNEWIDKLVRKAKKVRRPGNEINPFYLPAFVPQLSKLSKELPLWTSVNVPQDNARHATSSDIESYFNDIKSRILKTTPLRVDAFMKIHAEDIARANFVCPSDNDEA